MDVKGLIAFDWSDFLARDILSIQTALRSICQPAIDLECASSCRQRVCGESLSEHLQDNRRWVVEASVWTEIGDLNHPVRVQRSECVLQWTVDLHTLLSCS